MRLLMYFFLPFSLRTCSESIKMQWRHNLFLVFGSQEVLARERVRVLTEWLHEAKK